MELLIAERGEKMDGRHRSLLPVAPSATETGRSEDNVLPTRVMNLQPGALISLILGADDGGGGRVTMKNYDRRRFGSRRFTLRLFLMNFKNLTAAETAAFCLFITNQDQNRTCSPGLPVPPTDLDVLNESESKLRSGTVSSDCRTSHHIMKT